MYLKSSYTFLDVTLSSPVLSLIDDGKIANDTSVNRIEGGSAMILSFQSINDEAVKAASCTVNGSLTLL